MTSAAFTVQRVASADTPLTCNCLLPTPDTAPLPRLLTASYELCPAASDAAPEHAGECALYDVDTADAALRVVHRAPPPLPGVFDLTMVPASFFGAAAATSSPGAAACAVLACTDGSVRVLDAATLAPVTAPLSGLHAEMLTSCTPVYCATPHLLCSAHTGDVFLHALGEHRVTQALEGHEYDAWCTAMLPTGGWWAAGGDGQPAASAAGALLASGGDDGLCKLYDTRTDPRRAVSRTRFDAGVVSIAAVLDTQGCDEGAAQSTPYVLVGSYDESIALLDVRSMRRPVAQRTGLGGGVWRTSRCLRPRWSRSCSSRSGDAAAMAAAESDPNVRLHTHSAALHDGVVASCGWVNTENVLVLPLMQRGAALLPYDVRAAGEDVFGRSDEAVVYLYAEAGGEEERAQLAAAGATALTERSLIYDTAVLQPLRCGDATTAVVATVSFYEKRLDVWTVAAS